MRVKRFACLVFYVLAKSKVISGRVPTCHSAHSSQLYSAAPLGNKATSPMIWYPTQSHYPELANQPFSYPNNAKHLARKWQVSIFISHWFDSTRVRIHDLPHARPALYRFGHDNLSQMEAYDPSHHSRPSINTWWDLPQMRTSPGLMLWWQPFWSCL